MENKDLRNFYIRAVVIPVVLVLLIAAPFLYRRYTQTDDAKKTGSKVVRYGTRHFSWGKDKEAEELDVRIGVASDKQLKPSFGNLPHELFPGNRPFSLDFHKLPLDFLVPQSPEITRTAIVKIRQLQIADFAALEAQQAMARNNEKASESGDIK